MFFISYYLTQKFTYVHKVNHLLIMVHHLPLLPVYVVPWNGNQWVKISDRTQMKLFPKLYSSTSKFAYFPDVHHLLIKVHLVSLFPVHLGPQDCNRWLNKVDRTQLKQFSKLNCSTEEFPYFHEVHKLHIEVLLLLILPVHLGPPRWSSLLDCGGLWPWWSLLENLFFCDPPSCRSLLTYPLLVEISPF